MLATAFALLAQAEKSDKENLYPHAAELIVGAVAFAIIFFFMWKWVFPRVNAHKWMEFAGFLGHYWTLSDLERWRFMRQVTSMSQPPPANMAMTPANTNPDDRASEKPRFSSRLVRR